MPNLLDLYGLKTYDIISFDYGGQSTVTHLVHAGLFSQIILMLF